MEKFISTEESFHELSHIGSESILDLSNIERERVSPVSAGQVNELCSAVCLAEYPGKPDVYKRSR